MNQKRKREIFMRAAEAIANHNRDFCCTALKHECKSSEDAYYAMQIFVRLFKPIHVIGEFPWWRDYHRVFSDDQVRNPRVLALLLCAEMARTGDL